MFALSLTIYEIFANQKKCQNFDLETEGRGQGREKLVLRHTTRNNRFYVGDFLKF